MFTPIANIPQVHAPLTWANQHRHLFTAIRLRYIRYPWSSFDAFYRNNFGQRRLVVVTLIRHGGHARRFKLLQFGHWNAGMRRNLLAIEQRELFQQQSSWVRVRRYSPVQAVA